MPAQETPRSSVASSSNGLNDNNVEGGAYNLKAGPVLMSVSGGLSFSYNDNINLSQNDRKSDFILTPSIGLNNHWPISSINSADLNLGLSYSKYFENPSADSHSITVAPGSGLSFVVYMGDFKFTIANTFYVQHDPIDEIGLANVTTFGRISDTSSINVDWDLNDVLLSLGYAHTVYITTGAEFSYLNSDTDTVTQRTSFIITPTLTAGLSNSISFTSYDENFLNNNWTLMTGPFVSMQLSPNLSLSATCGLQLLNADTGGAVQDTSGNGVTSWYASVSLSHRINNYLNESLTLSRSNPTGFNSDFVGLYSLQHSITWQMMSKLTLTSMEFIEYSEDSGGSLAENVWRYGGSLSTGYQLTQKLSLNLTYNLTFRDSNADMRDYYQNVITLGSTYTF